MPTPIMATLIAPIMTSLSYARIADHDHQASPRGVRFEGPIEESPRSAEFGVLRFRAWLCLASLPVFWNATLALGTAWTLKAKRIKVFLCKAIYNTCACRCQHGRDDLGQTWLQLLTCRRNLPDEFRQPCSSLNGVVVVEAEVWCVSELEV